MKILDQYIVKELFGPFVTGTATFTILFMSMDTLFQVANMLVAGASFWSAMGFLLSSMPYILVLTFPMAVLLASLLAFGRLSSDSELVALKSGGVSFARIALPGMMLTLFISLCSFVLNEKVVPDATYRADNIRFTQLAHGNEALVENITLRDSLPDGSERRIFARKLDQTLGIMQDVTIQSYANGQRTREVFAQRVVWQGTRWIMYGVNTYEYDARQGVNIETSSDTAILTVSQSPADIAKRERMPEEMSRADLLQKIQDIDAVPGHQHDKAYNRYVLMYHEKVAIPLTCFVFGMLGMPLGVRPQRTSPSMGLGISLIFILFYYVLMTVAHALGESSVLPAGFAAWLPNVVFGFLGVFLIARASRT